MISIQKIIFEAIVGNGARGKKKNIQSNYLID